MSNKLTVTDWQLQSLVEKLEHHLTNGWKVDDNSVAFYNGLQFSVSLVKGKALLATEQTALDDATKAATALEGSTSNASGAEVVLDQNSVETPVAEVVALKKGTAKDK